jgi:hypothetical protein
MNIVKRVYARLWFYFHGLCRHGNDRGWKARSCILNCSECHQLMCAKLEKSDARKRRRLAAIRSKADTLRVHVRE